MQCLEQGLPHTVHPVNISSFIVIFINSIEKLADGPTGERSWLPGMGSWCGQEAWCVHGQPLWPVMLYLSVPQLSHL